MKALIAISSLIFTAFSFADDAPHIVSAPNCPAGQICCPTAVYCSYLEGCGNAGWWLISGIGMPQFGGVKRFDYDAVEVNSYNPVLQSYYPVICNYLGSEKDFPTGDPLPIIYLTSATGMQFNLKGQWVYGFMKQSAVCADNNPIDCTFTPIS